MTFQMSDFPRILPELMLIALALLVLGSDVLERWGDDDQARFERNRASGQLTALGLAIVLVVALVQSRYLFTVGGPLPGDGPLDRALNLLLGLGRNLQDAGPASERSAQPVLASFATDHLTMVARLALLGAALLTTVLTLDDQPAGHPGELYALLLVATAGMCIMAGATELILAYVGLELSAIALYVLAGYFRPEPRSVEAGLKYFLFGAVSSGVLLYGLSLAYGLAASAGGTAVSTLFATVGQATAAARPGTPLVLLALLMIIGGAGYKLAAVPFHGWAPDVYQGAAAPVAGFISTASKLAGFALLCRLLSSAFPSHAGEPGLSAGWAGLLAALALLSLIFGNLAALPQTNARRLLAYSGIGHAGFVLLAVLLWAAAAPPDRSFGAAALLYYLVTYALANLGAFGALAVLARATGGDDMANLNGLARRNAGLALMLTVLVLSLAGIPPLTGFWAKLFVFLSGYRAGALWLVALAVAMTVVSLYYYLRFLRAIWIAEPASADPVATPRWMQVALVSTTALTLLLGLFPAPLWDVLGRVTP